jgi:hypothetical protein
MKFNTRALSALHIAQTQTLGQLGSVSRMHFSIVFFTAKTISNFFVYISSNKNFTRILQSAFKFHTYD